MWIGGEMWGRNSTISRMPCSDVILCARLWVEREVILLCQVLGAIADKSVRVILPLVPTLSYCSQPSIGSLVYPVRSMKFVQIHDHCRVIVYTWSYKNQFVDHLESTTWTAEIREGLCRGGFIVKTRKFRLSTLFLSKLYSIIYFIDGFWGLE